MAANQTQDFGLGRVAEMYNRVQSNDPAASVLWIALIATTGIEADATLKIKHYLSDYVAGATNEATNTNYARKTLADAVLSAWAPDTGNHWTLLDFPDQTWTAVAADGTGAISAAVVGYDPSSSGVTATLMETLTQHAFAVTPDGSDLILQTPNGFFKAS
jgi:hypothetical protein